MVALQNKDESVLFQDYLKTDIHTSPFRNGNTCNEYKFPLSELHCINIILSAPGAGKTAATLLTQLKHFYSKV